MAVTEADWTPYLDDGDVVLHHGDCVEVMAGLDAESVDAVVTDPPYGLGFMGKEWDALGDHRPPEGAAVENRGHLAGRGRGIVARHRARFLGSENRQAQEWHQAWAAEALRVLKPGGHLLAFGGTRTYHRLTSAIEDAGFEIRDCLSYLYGSGFPKSHNPGCRCVCDATTEHDLRDVPDADVPTAEGSARRARPVLLAGVSESGPPADGLMPAAGGAGVAERLMEGRGHAQAGEGQLRRGAACPGAGVGSADGEVGRLHSGAPAGDGADDRAAAVADRGGASPGPRPVEQRPVEPGALADERGAQAGGGWPVCERCGLPVGLGSALKPAWEPVVVARKPLIGTVVKNVVAYGTGALNIDGCRIWMSVEDRAVVDVRSGADDGQRDGIYHDGVGRRSEGVRFTSAPGGRWPANVVLDEAAAQMLDDTVGERPSGARRPGDYGGVGTGPIYGEGGVTHLPGIEANTGGPSRFFYTAKASTAERDGATHPTVKPLALMRWLVRLVTPPGGLLLDPFAGSGTTLLAAREEGFRAIGIEREEEYAAMAAHRLRQLSLFGEVA